MTRKKWPYSNDYIAADPHQLCNRHAMAKFKKIGRRYCKDKEVRLDQFSR
jgi:hypothetical protein